MLDLMQIFEGLNTLLQIDSKLYPKITLAMLSHFQIDEVFRIESLKFGAL